MSDRSREARTLYGFWLSPYVSQVAHVMTEVGLAYEYERVSPYLAATQSDEHRSRNALGKIPTLRDAGGVEISESQAICRYLARVYPEARAFYPQHDAVRCAEVDTKSDFISFSIGGPFFNWFVFCAYFHRAWRLAIEDEASVFGKVSSLLVRGGVARLIEGSEMAPFLLGGEPFLPDVQLFYTLELGRTFARLFEMPQLDLVGGEPSLERFHAAMRERGATQVILAAQARELPISRQELFVEFGPAYRSLFDKRILERLFGHPV